MNKPTPFTKTFENPETFGAYNQALAFCRAQGISYGSSCAMAPTALLFGDYHIAKWRNLTDNERRQVHGTIDGDRRNGPVIVRIKAEFVHLLKEIES